MPTCLSFCSCFVIASLRRFWLLESSVLFESACFELAEPKQPIADQGAHQHADDVPPSGDVSGDSVVPRASPLRASININFKCDFFVLPHTVSVSVALFCLLCSASFFFERTENVVLLLLNVYVAVCFFSLSRSFLFWLMHVYVSYFLMLTILVQLAWDFKCSLAFQPREKLLVHLFGCFFVDRLCFFCVLPFCWKSFDIGILWSSLLLISKNKKRKYLVWERVWSDS